MWVWCCGTVVLLYCDALVFFFPLPLQRFVRQYARLAHALAELVEDERREAEREARSYLVSRDKARKDLDSF